MVALAPHLPREVLAAAGAIDLGMWRDDVLIALVPHLPREVLAAARAIDEEWRRARVLLAPAPHLPPAERAAALATALTTCVSFLTEETRYTFEVEALEKSLIDMLGRVELRASLSTEHLPVLQQLCIHRIASSARFNALQQIPTLIAILTRLSNETDLSYIYDAIRDVTRWWP